MVRHSGTPCILVHRAPQEEEGNKFERDKTMRGLEAGGGVVVTDNSEAVVGNSGGECLLMEGALIRAVVIL